MVWTEISHLNTYGLWVIYYQIFMRLSFITQFKIEFLLLFTGCRKVLGKIPKYICYIYVYMYNVYLSINLSIYPGVQPKIFRAGEVL